MTAKKKSTPIKSDKRTALIYRDENKTEERQLAEIKLSATTLNAGTVRNFTEPQIGEVDFMETIKLMKENSAKVNSGDLSDLESTLTSQAASLNSMFTELARRAFMNIGTHMQATESYMRLALKAQSQCARTIEVIATMKNPPIVYAKQANISNGNQQVNNGNSATITHAHAGEIINQPNELLSEVNNATMDSSRTATASGTDKAMATVEK